MNRLLNLILSKSFLPLVAVLALAALGWHRFRALPVDVFPDIAVPRVVLQTEAPGLTADFDWGTDLVRARFDVFERLQRVRETLPREVEVVEAVRFLSAGETVRTLL